MERGDRAIPPGPELPRPGATRTGAMTGGRPGAMICTPSSREARARDRHALRDGPRPRPAERAGAAAPPSATARAAAQLDRRRPRRPLLRGLTPSCLEAELRCPGT